MLYTLRGILEICYQESADRIEGPHPHSLARNQEEITAGFCVKVRKQEPHQELQVKPKARNTSLVTSRSVAEAVGGASLCLLQPS